MTPSTSHREPLDLVADDFLARYRRGERPSLSEYSERHPELAEDIRELFPALAMMEEAGKSDSQVPVPARIGEFRILRTIGRGGMGIVYEAEEESLGRRVALKVLPLHGLMNPKQLERFRREARAAAALHHNHIVPVYSVGQSEGVHYYAMQYIDGPSLDQVVEEVRLASRLAGRLALPAERDETPSAASGEGQETAQDQGAIAASTAKGSGGLRSRGEREYYRRVAELGLQAAEALSYAHGQGIVHRDIKPSNLLVDRAGKVWITDFGLAKHEGPNELTHTGDVIGTLRYMAPEQLQGWADPRTDIHGLGLVLYELVALRPAYEATARGELVRQVSEHSPPLLKKHDRRVSRDLETIVAKALAREPADRYASAAEMAADLGRFLAGQPVQARRTPSLERFRRWCGRNPVVASLTAAVALLLLSVAGVASAMNWQLQISLAATASAERAKTGQLWKSRLNEVLAMRHTGRPGQRVEAWEKLREAVALAQEVRAGDEARLELRNAAISTLALADLKHDQPGPAEMPGEMSSLRGFDPTLTKYLRDDADRGLSLRQVSDDRELAFLARAQMGAVRSCWFSSDGRRLALMGDRFRLRVWDLENRAVELSPDPQVKHGRIALSADARRLVIAQNSGLVTLYDVPSGRVTSKFLVPFIAGRMEFSSAGDRLAICGVKPHDFAIVCDLSTGLEVARLSQEGPFDAAWHPAGKLLAIAGNDFAVHVWNMRVLRKQCVLRGHQTMPRGLAFTADGDVIVTSAVDGTVRLWNAWTGRELVRCAGTMGTQLSADGRRLAVRKGRGYQMYEVVRSAEYRSLPLSAVAFSGRANCNVYPQHPTLGWLPVLGHAGLRLLDSVSGEELAFTPGNISDCAWAADGHALYTSGVTGLQRWPINVADGLGMPVFAEADGGPLILGPPERIGPIGPDVAVHPAGRHVVVGGYRVDLGPQPAAPRKIDHAIVAFSRDGKWFVANENYGTEVWRTEDDEPVKLLAPEAYSQPRFSPDSRFLAASSIGSIRLWRVGEWTELRDATTDGSRLVAFDFSPNGKYLAYARTPYEVRLEETETGKQLAILEAPDDLQVEQLQFSLNGEELFVATDYPPTLRVWNLRLVGERLESINLGYGFPSWPKPAPTHVPPRRVLFDEGLNAVQYRVAAEKHQSALLFKEAVASFELSRLNDPEHSLALAQLAWLLANGPSTVRDHARAEELARECCELDPTFPLAWNALGAALLRLNRPDEALPVLRQAEDLLTHASAGQQKWDSINGFLIALAQHQLGQKDIDRPTVYDKSVGLLARRKLLLEPAVLFYAEALRNEAGLALGVLPKPRNPDMR